MALKDRMASMASPAEKRHMAGSREDLVAQYRVRLLEEIDLDEVAGLELPQQRARLERILSRLLSLEGPVLSPRERTWLVKRIIDDAVASAYSNRWWRTTPSPEIMVNGHGRRLRRALRKDRAVPTRFTSEAELYQLIDRIVSSVNRRVDESSPMVDARLPGGERVNVIIPPLALDGPTITIRRFPQPFQLTDLVARHSLPQEAADLLGTLVAAKFSILISGGTGSGKTTFLNALSGMIPQRERIITIEDAAELSLQQPHVVRLEARPANIEGRGQVAIRDLVRNSLRMRPDRIIVGEVRGGETLDMLQAMNTGHEGSLTTVHANSAVDALSRLEHSPPCPTSRSLWRPCETRSTAPSTSSSNWRGIPRGYDESAASSRSRRGVARTTRPPRSCTTSTRRDAAPAVSSSAVSQKPWHSGCSSTGNRCPVVSQRRGQRHERRRSHHSRHRGDRRHRCRSSARPQRQCRTRLPGRTEPGSLGRLPQTRPCSRPSSTAAAIAPDPQASTTAHRSRTRLGPGDHRTGPCRTRGPGVPGSAPFHREDSRRVLAAAVPFAFSRWMQRRAAQRTERFIAQLPDVSRVLSNGTSAGMSV